MICTRVTETRVTENGLGTEQGLGLGVTPRPEGRKGMSIIAHPLREQPLPLLPSAVPPAPCPEGPIPPPFLRSIPAHLHPCGINCLTT